MLACVNTMRPKIELREELTVALPVPMRYHAALKSQTLLLESTVQSARVIASKR
jgi:hypothetical protein